MCVALLTVACFSSRAQSHLPRSLTPAQALDNIVRRSAAIVDSATEASAKSGDQRDGRNLDEAARIAREAARYQIVVPGVSPGTRSSVPTFGNVRATPVPRPGVPDAFAVQSELMILVSDSMPTADLRASLEVASESGATVVFRGVRRGEGIATSLRRMHGLGKGIDPAPRVVIDPRPFERFQAAVAPMMVLFSQGQHVSVAGSLSVSFLRDRFAAGAFGDYGARGVTYQIVEVDMIEEMRARLGSIDWDARKMGAIDRAWTNFQMMPKPNAEASAVRSVDPTVIVGDDITLPDGRLLASAGSRFNPLDILPFSKTIVVINASDPRQLAYAKRVAAETTNLGRGVVILTTDVDRSRGWQAYKEHSEALFPHRLHLLTSEVDARFGIRVVPSHVRSEGNRFIVTETAASSLPEN